MAETFSYELNGNLYINLTNKCSNYCNFCVRNGKDAYYGNKLWLNREPSVKDVADGIDFSKNFGEAVFCGFGEPTYRIKEVCELARIFKDKGYKTRLNTNGQGNLINGRDITPEMSGLIDKVNVSLNASDSEKYQSICNSKYGTRAFSALLSFATLCRINGIDAVLSVVDVIGAEEVARCNALAEVCGLTLHVRKFIKDN